MHTPSIRLATDNSQGLLLAKCLLLGQDAWQRALHKHTVANQSAQAGQAPAVSTSLAA